MFIYIILSFIIAFLLCMSVMPRILLVSYKKKLFDTPDSRKVHTTPVPRLGGLVFVPIIIITMAFIMGLRYRLDDCIFDNMTTYVFISFCAFIVGVMIIYLIGVKDDLIGAGYKIKFVVQFTAACLFPLSGLWVHSFYGFLGIEEIPWFIGMPFTVLMVVYITNAINLIDGVDGLASGLSLIGFTVMGFCCYRTGMYVYAILATSAVGVLIPFLNYNVRHHKKKLRKIFMGDAGSLTLGFLMSFLLLVLLNGNMLNHPERTGHPFIALGAFVIPLFDVIRVVLSRIRDGRAPFLPDMNHIHHKCIRTGMSPRQTMIFLLCMSCVFVIVNKVLIYQIWGNVLFVDLAIWFVMHLVLNCFITKREAKTGRVWDRKRGRYAE